MRLVIQRVKGASVKIEGAVEGSINQGLLILVGVTHDDTAEDVDWLVNKVVNMRIFSDAEGKMNLSLEDIDGEALVVSQFTLHASTKKGNRPSYIKSARPKVAIPLYKLFVDTLSRKRTSTPRSNHDDAKFSGTGNKVKTGVFGADMQIELINDGPVTITIDSKNRE